MAGKSTMRSEPDSMPRPSGQGNEGAENRSRQLFNKNTGLCQIERSSIQPDTCPVLEG